MMRKIFKKISQVILLFILISTVTGCNSTPGTIDDPLSSSIVYTLNNDIPEYIEPQEVDGNTRKAISSFATNLMYQAINTGETNIVISPISIYLAMSMVLYGSSGETLNEFANFLNLEAYDLTLDDFHLQLHSLINNLTATDEANILKIANSVWISDEYLINSRFNVVLYRFFNALVQSIDIFDPASVEMINNWVYESTNGLIDNVKREISIDTIMILINTLYFNALWHDDFSPMSEEEMMFYPIEEDPYYTTFLTTNDRPFWISISESYEAAMLPYENDRFGLVLVQPTNNQDIRSFIQANDIFNLILIPENSITEVSGIISFPKLTMETSIQMNEILISMGLNHAFDSDYANFSNIVLESLNNPISISDVSHIVKLNIDRYGTEAAAVTSVVIEAMVWREPPSFHLIFNSPFAFYIYDFQESIVLFMGIVDYP